MKKIPYGIIDFRELRENDYYYVDKTDYLEKLENVGKTLVYLRPGRFGKSLFISMMFYYYDVESRAIFEDLYKNTYVYNHPTRYKNNYYVLRLDFSGIISVGRENRELERAFTKNVQEGIMYFNNYYNLSYIINDSLTAEVLIKDFILYFASLKKKEKLYIIIDEYDNFTNAILEGNAEKFTFVLGKTGIVKSFYAAIKQYVGTGLIGRVFITGICPITLNSMTSGFNIAKDLSTDKEFNAMVGLTHDEVEELIKDIEPENHDLVYKIMLDYYDGYLFNGSLDKKDRVFNATLVMYFLDYYYRFREIPKELMDVNVAFNCGKIGDLLKLQNNNFYISILKDILDDDRIIGRLSRQFNLEEMVSYDNLISLLYYFGYLTIETEHMSGRYIFKIPNYVTMTLYANYFISLFSKENINLDMCLLEDALQEMYEQGKINKLCDLVSNLLVSMDNRIFMNFSEKDLEIMFYTLLVNSNALSIRVEQSMNQGYADLYIESKNIYCKYDFLIEFKYIKGRGKNIQKCLNEKEEEAINQIEKYSKDNRIHHDKLMKYVVIFVNSDAKLIKSVQ